MHRRHLLALLTAPLLGAPPARADEDDDDDEGDAARARAAVEAGEIRPLAGLLVEVEHRFVGRVIETRLRREDGRWEYRFQLLPPSGHVFEVRLDAATGAVRRTRGPVQERGKDGGAGRG